MANRIPQAFIDDLLARIDIVELIDTRVTLKKTGVNYAACCPFHTEKTPSFTVSPTKQFYHCFGCGAHGNAIGFLMAYDRLEFIDAIETLAHQLGMMIPNEIAQETQKSYSDLYGLLEKATQYYQTQLNQAPNAQSYLQKRGVSAEMIQRFRIGFAPAGWDSLLRHLVKSSAIKAQLVEAGMLIKSNQGKIYDRFRERLMFPIRDLRGRIIGFGGRTLGSDTPKYLNSPETPIFHKGSELYGLFEARQANQKLDQVLIVEGYMDVIALAQHGLTQAVATLGTATSSKHLQRLFRYTQELIFCFDGDDAGQHAAWRALEICLPMMRDGLQIRFMFLPQGEDPDSLIRKEGAILFTQRMTTALPLAEFFFKQLRSQANPSTLEGRAKLVKLATDFLNKMPKGIFHQLMMEQLATIVGMDLDNLISHQLVPKDSTVQIKPSTHNTKQLSPIRLAIALILQHPHLIQEVPLPESVTAIPIKGISILTQLYAQIGAQPQLSTGGLLEHWRHKKEGTELAKLAAWDLLIPSEGARAELMGVFDKLTATGLEQQLQQLLAKANQDGLTVQEKQTLLKLLEKKTRL